MKKIIINAPKDTIRLEDIPSRAPIFAYKNGKVAGLVTKSDEGYLLSIGYDCGATGHRNTIQELIHVSQEYGYEFFINE